MARASIRTKLPLDRFAEILGINPLHFNQLYSELTRQDCGEVYFQYAHQDLHKISREDIARAIRRAEDKIENYIGYNLLPDWTNEYVRTTRPARPELYGMGYAPRWDRKSVSANKGYVITGGQKAQTLIEAGVAVVRSDVDGDGYDETMTATATTTATVEEEIRAYFPGESGAEAWEIRPISVSIAAGVATITFKSWQLVDPDLQQGFNAASIDGDAAASYLDTIDVYRVYTDISEQVLFMWEALPDTCDCGSTTCLTCSWSTQNGCLQVRDSRLGIVTFTPGTWSASDEGFLTAEWSVSREPEKMRLWYYSGWRDLTLDGPSVEMDRFWADAVAIYSVALLDRRVCECTNVSNFFDHYREDLARQGSQVAFQISPSIADNAFGSTRGAIYARGCCAQEGRRVAK